MDSTCLLLRVGGKSGSGWEDDHTLPAGKNQQCIVRFLFSIYNTYFCSQAAALATDPLNSSNFITIDQITEMSLSTIPLPEAASLYISDWITSLSELQLLLLPAAAHDKLKTIVVEGDNDCVNGTGDVNMAQKKMKIEGELALQ